MSDVREYDMVPLKLLHENERGDLTLNVERLEEILQDKMLKGRRIVTISVVGAFRKGKSFLLNAMKNHLDTKGSKEWTEAPLSNGFPCRAGATRETKGILVWPEVFLNDHHNLAVLLLDTQGLFDDESSFEENTLVFTFATLISSIQIFNVSQQIQMDDMMHLQMFLELGRLTMEFDATNPFQKLIFLVRDWPHKMEFNLGLQGGQKLLQEKWLNNGTSNSEKLKIRQTLTECFSEVQCCLLCYPGKTIAEGYSCDNLLQGDPEFVEHFSSFVCTILSEEYLTPKCVAGVEIKVEDFVDYIRKIYKSLQSDGLPVVAIVECMAEVANSKLRREGVAEYIDYMNKHCQKAVDDLNIVHEEAVARAQQIFDSQRKLGGDDLAKPHRDRMMQDIQQQLININALNEERKQVASLEMQRKKCQTNESVWRESSLRQQQQLLGLLGNRLYDQIPISDHRQILESKVGYAIYGPPTTDEGLGYNEENLEIIREICEKIRKQGTTGENIYFSSIHVFWADLEFKEAKVAVLFRISKNEMLSEHVFIDVHQRVYKNWDDYIRNNKLPQCWMCFPKDGVYTADEHHLVEVEFEKSVACGIKRKVASFGSTVAISAMVTSAAVVGASLLIPVAGPLLTAGSICSAGGSTYTFVDSTCTLINRYKHNQSIAPNNVESAFAWLNIGVSPISFATSFMVLQKEIPLYAKIFQTTSASDNLVEVSTNLGPKSLWFISYIGSLLRDLENGEFTLQVVQQIRAYLMYFFHIFVDRSTPLGGLAEAVVDIMTTPLHGLPQYATLSILGLIVCASPQEIVQQLSQRGIGLGTQNIFA